MSRLSLESIAYQGKSNRLVNGLTTLYTDALEYYANGELNRVIDTLEEIGAHIKSVTGINMTVTQYTPSLMSKVFMNSYTAAVTIPNGVQNLNPVDQHSFKRLTEGELDSKGHASLINGKIDFKKGTVSGYYTQFSFNMRISTTMLEGKISAESLVGVTLHELAHAWDYLVHIGIGTITTALAAGVHEFFDRYSDPAKRMRLFIRVTGDTDPNIDIKDLTPDNATVYLVANSDRWIKDWTGIEFKSGESGEYLADQFAVKWGGGLSLVTALRDITYLDSLVGKLSIPSRWSGGVNTALNVFTGTLFLNLNRARKATNATAATLGAVAVRGVGIELLVAFLVEVIAKATHPYGQHPSISSRVERIRSDLVGTLREVKNPAEKQLILKDLEALDILADEVTDWREMYRSFFRDIVRQVSGRTREDNFKRSVAERNNNRLYELLARIEATK